MKNTSIILMFVLFAGSFFAPLKNLKAQENAKSQQVTSENAVKYLRLLHYNRDFELAVNEGEQLVQEFPKFHQVRAWYISSMVRNDMAKEALDSARAMVENYPESAWSYFALARALNAAEDRGKEAIKISDKALSMKPQHPDFLWMKAAVISEQQGERTEIAFIDSVTKRRANYARLLARKGHGLFNISQDAEGEKKEEIFQKAMAVFEKVRSVDSTCFDAWYLPAYYVNRRGDKQQAFRFYKQAVSLSTALRAHNEYWRLISSMDHMGPDEKEAAILADIKSLEGRRPATAKMMYYIATRYGEFGMNKKQKKYEEYVLDQYPNDVYTEWVLVNRYRNYRSEHGKQIFEEKNPKIIAVYRNMLWDFINRPTHNRETLIGDAYRSLFYTYREDSTAHADTLLQVVNGMVRHEGINVTITHGGGAKLLAERDIAFERAKEIAREGVGVAREKIKEQREWAYDTEKEYKQAMDRYTAIMYDALGWVFFHEGKLDSSKKYLGKAYSQSNENPENLYHLGKLYEADDNFSKAEKYYQKGVPLQQQGENRNKAALKNLYVKMHGSEEGYKAYLIDLQSSADQNRKKEILEDRAENPEPVPAFTLANLGGDKISSNDLNNNIAVINIWGIWCGPCVQEMPDIQKLHEKYKDHPGVTVLTINNDPSIDKVKKWMKEHDYTFTVLRDNGYLQRADVHVFPTTWFLNQDAAIAFTKEGYTKKLVKEFTWRIDELKK